MCTIIYIVTALLFCTVYLTGAHRINKRAAVWKTSYKWPEGVIPYLIDRSAFTDQHIILLQDAMTTWNMETCINFRPRLPYDKNWIKITGGTNCYSNVGMKTDIGEQIVNLADPGCRYYGLYLHELGHVIGLHHEHIRPDRDHYMQVHKHNIIPGLESYYDAINYTDLLLFNLPYDLQSVMHYGPLSFTGPEGEPTIQVKNENLTHLLDEVYNKDLSFLDAKVVNLFYECSKKCMATDLRCPEIGFVDQFCQCHTPETFEERRCRNINEDRFCEEMKQQGKCETLSAEMAVNCRKTCDKCYKYKSRFVIRKKKCRNFESDASCDSWARNGECLKNPLYMKMNCKVACGVCTPDNKDLSTSTDSSLSTSSTNSKCLNRYGDTKCVLWAYIGECYQNHRFMEVQCAKACGLCTDLITESPVNSTLPVPVKCNDDFDPKSCYEWSLQGECKKNPTYMRENCKWSCGLCNESIVEPCRNLYDNLSCYIWSTAGECKTKFMKYQCKSSCNICSNKSISIQSITTNKHLLTVTMPTSVICEDKAGSYYCKLWKNQQRCLDKDIQQKCSLTCGKCDLCLNKDNELNCEKWKQNGECWKNPDYMMERCARSCGKCKTSLDIFNGTCVNLNTDKTCERWSRLGECNANPTYMIKQCAKTCGICVDINKIVCSNAEDDMKCEKWKVAGECELNPKYMLNYCAKTCHNCKSNLTQTCINIDEDSDCEKWSKSGECDKNWGYMSVKCAKSCKLCRTDGLCANIDNDNDCDKWSNAGECINNPIYMMVKCRKSCGQCKNYKEICNNKFDDGKCDLLASENECEKNPKYMSVNCAKSCNACQGEGSVECKNKDPEVDCEKWSKAGECEKNPRYMSVNCAKSCKVCQGGGSVECKNKDPEVDCEKWSKAGECEKNPRYMSVNCAKSCKVCQGEGSVECKNKDPEVDCEKWSKAGECEKNPRYMSVNCAKSCKVCQEAGSRVCKNLINDSFCDQWAKNGHCYENSIFMLINCKKSCFSCSFDRNSCQDILPKDECISRRAKNDCFINRKFMSIYCKNSCGRCLDNSKNKTNNQLRKCVNIQTNQMCETWKFYGQCQDNWEYMSENCFHTCSNCSLSSYSNKIDKCSDLIDSIICKKLVSFGDCKSNRQVMLKNCRKSCGLCKINEDDFCRNLYKDDRCNQWKLENHCVSNKDFMKQNCRVTCRFCLPKTTVDCLNLFSDHRCKLWKERGDCEKNPEFLGALCAKSCNLCGKTSLETVTSNKKSCVNKYDDVSCQSWKEIGECDTNRIFMEESCARSCGYCDSRSSKLSNSRISGRSKVESCRNLYDNDLCDEWADNQECGNNPGFMHVNCVKSCMLCNNIKSDYSADRNNLSQLQYSTKQPTKKTSTSTTSSLSVGCINQAGDSQCSYWARNQQCIQNAPYMLRYCARACQSCKHANEQTTKPCQNKYDSVTCVAWAKRNECNRNRDWMTENCALSCQVCKPQLLTKPCRDTRMDCLTIESMGKCPEYTKQCPKTCRLCSQLN